MRGISHCAFSSGGWIDAPDTIAEAKSSCASGSDWRKERTDCPPREMPTSMTLGPLVEDVDLDVCCLMVFEIVLQAASNLNGPSDAAVP